MPTAMYSCGLIVLPVCPTWWLCGIQPASTAARDAPTAPPSASARSLRIVLNGSGPPRPPPPPPTTDAPRRLFDAQLARSFDDLALDLHRVRLAGRLGELHDLAGPGTWDSLERIRPDRGDAILALEGTGGDGQAAEFRRDAVHATVACGQIDDVGGNSRTKAGGEPAADVASDHRVRHEDQRRPRGLGDRFKIIDLRVDDERVDLGVLGEVNLVDRIGL